MIVFFCPNILEKVFLSHLLEHWITGCFICAVGARPCSFLPVKIMTMGLYLGSHDHEASLKTFIAKSESGYLKFAVEISAMNKTMAGNDWSLPVF